jgi:hypothetical protein
MGSMTTFGLALFDQHAAKLAASTITPEHARARGYVSVDTKVRLEGIGVTKIGRNVPGLLVPMRDKHGQVWGYQYRPDNPRINSAGKPIKYETPTGQRNGIDVPASVGPKLDDPTVPLWVTEGSKKADAAACSGLACTALPGVWSWRGTNTMGGKVAVPDWHDIALNGRQVVLAFDSDAMSKRTVRQALDQLAGYLATKGATVRYLHLPDNDDGKTGLDDYLGAGHTVDELRQLIRPEPPQIASADATPDTPLAPVPAVPPEPVGLDQVHTVFRRWLGKEYDTDALDVVLAAAAVEQLTGDPVWLLLISGSGNAKTETVLALDGIGATVTSTVSSAGALLSGTSRRERSSDATGGLLQKLGEHGLLVVKDVTSILSMDRNARAEVLAALREVYDGRWSRNVGTDGGRTLDWAGRITLIGAVTTAWDRAHDVVASMGDRFVLVRVDSTTGRQAAGLRAIGNAGSEIKMREELAAAVGGVLVKLELEPAPLDEDETNLLLAAADLVTLARTGVDYDSRGDVIDAHAPEMPTRFAKQLAQIVRAPLQSASHAQKLWPWPARARPRSLRSRRTSVSARAACATGSPRPTSTMAVGPA